MYTRKHVYVYYLTTTKEGNIFKKRFNKIRLFQNNIRHLYDVF